MNTNWMACTVMMVGLALPARAALEFTNVTEISTPAGIPTLNGVAYDGDDTFVAVGENSAVLRAEFVTSLPWFSNSVPASAQSLKSVAYGAGLFAAGAVNVVFSSSNATSWPTISNPFGLAVNVQGLAYNSNALRFAAVSSFVNISYADSAFASWTFAGISNSVLVESFRSVTALPGSGFAACGLRGDIRISTNSGAGWIESQKFTSSEPDLFGITSGGGRIMAVGSAGRVMVSTNLGTNWVISAPIDTNHINNAVAFTGNEFIVIGDGGRIFTSTDTNANNWTSNRIQSATNVTGSLRGVAFATAGKMRGLAVVVGDNGTVILGGTRPPEFTNPTNQTVCSGSGNTNLSVNLDTNGFPIGTLVVEWVNANGQLVASNLAASVNYLAATNTIPAGGNYASNFVYSVRARDLRTGFANTNNQQVTLTVNPRPTAVVSGNTMICQSSSTNIQALLTGIGPWNVTWSDGILSNNVGGSVPGPVTVTRTVNPTVTTVYTVTNLTDASSCTARTNDLIGSATIILDNVPPVVTCRNITVNLDNTGNATITAAQLVAAATDNCVVVATNLSRTNFTCVHVGTNNVTVTVIDSNNNSNACVAQVTVLDLIPPSIFCPANITVTNALGQCGSNVTFTVTATDNCGVTSTNSTPPSGFAFPVGVTTVTNVATDIHGNTNVCSFTVTVTDAEKPTITAPTGVAKTNDVGQCYATGVVLGAPTATNDNCGILSVTNNAPVQFPVGPTTVTWTVWDIHGNFATATQTVTVTDVQKPNITCPANIAVTNSLGQCGSNVTFTVTATDNCGVSNIVSTPASGFAFPVGVTTVANVATDIHGNTNVCTFTVTVTDTQKPTITAPVTVNTTNDVGQCYATAVVLGAPVATNDNCGILSVTNNAPAQFEVGTNQVVWTVWDIHGNFATATQSVIVAASTPCASLTITRQSATTVVVKWFGIWALQSATNLNAPVWKFETNGTAGLTNQWVQTLIPPPTNSYFRLVLTNAP